MSATRNRMNRLRVLESIRNGGPSSATELGDRLGIDKALARWHARALIREGLIVASHARRYRGGSLIYHLPGQVVPDAAPPMTPEERRLRLIELKRDARARERAVREGDDAARVAARELAIRVWHQRARGLHGQPPEVVEAIRRRTLAAWGGLAS
jgi:DNA-binding IclR family transcriptional regulator